MKPPTIFKIAVEALITMSLIALLGLLTALTYALLSFLGAEPTDQSLLTSQTETPEVTVKNLTAPNPVLPDATVALPSAKAAPKLKAMVKEVKTEIIAEVATKPLTKMTVQELRPLAKERKIPNWRKLKKKELIFYLTA
ncbi:MULTISPECIES: Rho termination factor N-terminal domain-containing protein [Pseudanabaena]|uniref:Rho termination factor domain protein n=2 Tax=Pseudanabaena TaxID=1152 RepID=L8MQN0_9CYAN|nr:MULTISPECIES: Rho termination factor N-terminal domain-containing protein [Pseudanabaena]ELS30212.1 Rho termination factor domain protein [Pseudanabaena biceps PCC 7429]MDG3497501.1 Rho termination factor N-terminal domain-containing protein [Pseudanabaena catenata USMAC16]